MEALSLDLRQRICAACDEQAETRQEVADRFGVSRSFVQKLLRRRRLSGSIAPKPHSGGAKPLMSRRDYARVQKLVNNKPDATLAELRRGLAKAGGASVSAPTMCRALQALSLRLKKRRCMPRSVTRRVSGLCEGIGRSVWRKWTPRSWFSWTKVASTPP